MAGTVPEVTIASVGVVGLSSMGRAVALRLRAAMLEVVAWSPSGNRPAELVAADVRIAGDLPECLRDRSVVLLALSRYADTAAVAACLGDIAPGAVVVQLAPGGPDGPALARRWSEPFRAAGVDLLDAVALMLPDQLGGPHAALVCAGPLAALDRAAPVLSQLDPSPIWVGGDAGQAKVVDAALLPYGLTDMLGLFQAAALLDALGGSLEAFGAVARRLGHPEHTLSRYLPVLATRRYDRGSDVPLEVHLAGVRACVGQLAALGIPHAGLAEFADLLGRAADSPEGAGADIAVVREWLRADDEREAANRG